ncbi:conjugative transposon protein TraM [Flavobacterium sp. L1I52]|uniref:Conjugative transposon protein TraM n=1 Tax=Flavobacterium pokkalii TaxID=1940408 RepID=A0ABR7UPI1_9FLAO|nr:conjugative transposon protein TraM [Flavobacterium pokkalii]MBD0724799.1 conjugative transposon protein TraM [Flavobacterium pokkalii]
MKESENKKSTIFVTDGNLNETSEIVLESSLNKGDKFKKPLIFVLMGIVFLGCMYIIFKPSESSKKTEDIGLNDSVPQATDKVLQADKQKAYEDEMLEQKNLEKQNALTSLSDYWNENSTDDNENGQDVSEKNEVDNSSLNNDNPSLNSYRNAQNTLGNFYQSDNSEALQLRKQLDELKEQLAKKNDTPIDPVESQLELMEKSYQMAAKYLPTNAVSGEQPKEQKIALSGSSNQKETFVAFVPAHKNEVSSLQRVLPDSTFIANWSENRNRGFYTVGKTEQQIQPKNSIRAVVQQTQLLTEDSSVRLRLLESAKIGTHIIPAGTVLTANSKFQQGRVQMKITSIEQDGNIIPVNIIVYGLDGQEGLFVPYSPEMSAFKEMAANMGQTSGSSIMMTNSAGQQIAGDLSRGLVQGVSGYFSKKMRTPKVTLKAGHQVFLVSKK